MGLHSKTFTTKLFAFKCDSYYNKKCLPLLLCVGLLLFFYAHILQYFAKLYLLQCHLNSVDLNETCLKCGAGWELHGGNCYNFNTMKSSWNESRDSCKYLGGDLVKIDSREEQMFLFGRLSNFTVNEQDKFWIGLTDSEEEDRWLWADGSPLNSSLTFWADNQPDNKSLDGAAEADCVRMGKKGGADFLKSWFDTSCNYPQKSICEKAAETGQSSCVYG
uniref:C-type lectin domain-containing protein n=1 Tax=Fundulus heteroclitus TaxID=8078 RepID=A0A3Q2P3G7_FUNHE